MNPISTRLKRQIEILEISDAEAGRRCGFDQKTIWNYTNGREPKGGKILTKLADGLGMTFEQLVTGKGFDEVFIRANEPTAEVGNNGRNEELYQFCRLQYALALTDANMTWRPEYEKDISALYNLALQLEEKKRGENLKNAANYILKEKAS